MLLHDFAFLISFNFFSFKVLTLSASRGIDLSYVSNIPDLMATNGIIDIEGDFVSLPIGWGGRLGELYGRNVYLGWTAPAAILEPILGLTREGFTSMATKTFAEMKAKKSWHKARYVFGRKSKLSDD